jgi:hypothetical protein
MYYELWFAKESKDEVLAQLSTSSLKIVDVNNKRWVVALCLSLLTTISQFAIAL